MTEFEAYRKYKTAKVIAKDLEDLNVLLRSMKKELATYYRYIPVKNIFAAIVDNQAVLNSHLKKQNSIINEKEKNG